MTDNLLDILSYIDRQKRESYRAFFIVGEANCGESDFAKKVAEEAGGRYLDLLELFLNDKSLKDIIDTFRPINLEKLLLRHWQISPAFDDGKFLFQQVGYT